jgi:hypothetical protein
MAFVAAHSATAAYAADTALPSAAERTFDSYSVAFRVSVIVRICEAHSDKPWPHGDCAGPGMPCDVPTCPHRMDRASSEDGDWRGLPAVPSAGGEGGAGEWWTGDGVPGVQQPLVSERAGHQAALRLTGLLFDGYA